MLQFQPQINIRVPSRRLWQWKDSKSFIYMDMSIMDFAVWNLLPNSIRRWDGFITTHAILFIYVAGSIWHISWNYREKMVRKPLCLGCNNHFLTKVSPIIRNEEKNKHIQIPSYCQGEKVWLLTLLTKFKYVPFKTTTIHIYPILTRLKSLQINNKIHHSRVIHHLGRSVYNYITIVI